MIPGSVVYWPGFTFDDGGRSDKLLAIIGSRGAEARLLFKTTSQPSEYRPDNDGCHFAQSVFRFKNNLAGFDEPTWVQFDPPFIYNVVEMVALGIRVKFTLKPPDLQAIINCYKRSDDTAPEYLKFVN